MGRLALWKQIVIAIIVGILVGVYLPGVVPKITFLGEIFMRLLKMLIAPLVLFTLISGVCKMGDIKQLRTVGVRIVSFYLIASAIAASLGMIFALVSQPGKGVIELLGAQSGKAVEYSFLDNMISWIPTNIFEALSTGNTLQIIVFAIFLGTIFLALGEVARPAVKFVDSMSEAMIKMTDMVMVISPIGIFALIADMVTKLSGKMLGEVLNMIVTDWVACVLMIFIIQPVAVKLMTGLNPVRFLKNCMPALLVAASTTSSAATLPMAMKCADRELGVPENIYGFSLPLGNTCNMNGMAIALGVISIFASNVYGLEITMAEMIQFVFLGLVLSVGCAGVKGAGIVMSTVLLQTLGLPLDIVPLLAAIWPLIDIGHTTANISGDLVGTTIVADSLGALNRDIYNK